MPRLHYKALAPLVLILPLLALQPLLAQKGAEGGEWRSYGGDVGSTKYSPLDQINADNVSELEIACHRKADNFGPRLDYTKHHPAVQGVDLSGAGNPHQATLMVTKELLFGGVGGGLFGAGTGGGSPMFRVYNKATGDLIYEMELPTGTTGIPMTYMANGHQYIVVAVGGRGIPAELVALAVP